MVSVSFKPQSIIIAFFHLLCTKKVICLFTAISNETVVYKGPETSMRQFGFREWDCFYCQSIQKLSKPILMNFTCHVQVIFLLSYGFRFKDVQISLSSDHKDSVFRELGFRLLCFMDLVLCWINLNRMTQSNIVKDPRHFNMLFWLLPFYLSICIVITFCIYA